MSSELALDQRLQDYIRQVAVGGREVERVGPFVATFDPRSTNTYVNYAFPDEGATPSAEDVQALVTAYRRRERVPRLEFFPAVAPEVAGIGVAASHRRRGIAGAVTSALTAAAIAAGVELAWLTPGHEDAHRVYARAGFQDKSTMLHMALGT